MSESTSTIISANGSDIEENLELNVSNDMSFNVEKTRDKDQNMEISDDESSTVTIGEISVSEYYDDIRPGKQLAHKELYYNDQNEQSGSSNNVNIVNNKIKNYNERSLEGQAMIVKDIYMAIPTITEVKYHVHTYEHSYNYTQQHTFDETREHTHKRILNKKVCFRQACNNLVMPVRTIEPRSAAIEAAEKLAKFCTKRKYSNKKRNKIVIYYSCGHLEKIGCTTLKHIGIRTPLIMKEFRLLDERLMKTTFYLLKLPSTLTVYQILCDYQRKADMNRITLDYIFTAFNHGLLPWCLYYVERLQYEELVVRFPNREMSELYGLAHLIRFIASLPRLYIKMKYYATEFNDNVTEFMNGLMDYLIEENLFVDIEKDYEQVTPEYHRLAYL